MQFFMTYHFAFLLSLSLFLLTANTAEVESITSVEDITTAEVEGITSGSVFSNTAAAGSSGSF
jgi:hypothetical protein